LAQQETPEQQAAVLCRACGHGIYLKLERKGVRLGLLAFFDDEPSSPTYGERVQQCPGCGKSLAIHNVLTKKSPQGWA
jgi:pyruvate/2-oxoacid:ferredoxin oxidoreductase beta subunit